MLIAETLKKSILQAAIQGKLTEQLPSDGSAKDLLAKIKAEKQKLTAEGKIKKEKPLAPITDDEKPFEIPENWEWVRLGEVGIWNSGATPSRGISEYYRNGNIPWLKTGDLNDGLITEVPEYITQKAVDNSSMSLQPKGAVLIAMYGATIGKLGVLDIDATTNQACCACAPYSGLYNWYLFYALLQHKDMFIKQGAGGAQPNISKEKIVNSVIPLPPLAEQKRIVERVEELFAEIEKLEKDEKQLEELQKAFPTKLKNSLLQAAMQGKLTEQLPSDGNAKDLLDRIKKRTQIEDDEIPFDIPENWVWIKIADLCSVVNGFTPLRSNSEFWDKGTIPWFTVDDIHTQGRIIRATKQHITQKALSKDTSRVLPINTVVLCCTASVGEYALTKIPLTTNQQFNGLVIKENLCADIDANYLFSIAPTFKDRLLSIAGKTTFNFISVKKLNQLTIPLPPLAEQKRIVEKLEELLPLCEDLAE